MSTTTDRAREVAVSILGKITRQEGETGDFDYDSATADIASALQRERDEAARENLEELSATKAERDGLQALYDKACEIIGQDKIDTLRAAIQGSEPQAEELRPQEIGPIGDELAAEYMAHKDDSCFSSGDTCPICGTTLGRAALNDSNWHIVCPHCPADYGDANGPDGKAHKPQAERPAPMGGEADIIARRDEQWKAWIKVKGFDLEPLASSASAGEET